MMRVKSSKSTAELRAGREVLRAGSTSLRASFTVSLLGDDQGCVCFVWFLCLLLGCFLLFCFVTGVPLFLVFSIRCTRTSFIHDCHHRHDERSTGAKKKVIVYNFFCSIMSIRTFSILFLLHLHFHSGVGAFLWDFTKALFFRICVHWYFSLWRDVPAGISPKP